jgi:hypothetical protein
MRSVVLAAVLVAGCAKREPPPFHSMQPDLPVPAAPCPDRTTLYYFGFEGSGAPPPSLDADIRGVLPDRIPVESAAGRYDVLTSRALDGPLRTALDAAASRSGWKLAVVDWGMALSTTDGCKLHFVHKY